MKPKPKNQKKKSLALVLCLDHSGSMGESGGTITKWEEALQSLFPIDWLKPEDWMGLILFSQSAKVVLPLQQRPPLTSLVFQLRKMEPQGGTKLLPPLWKAWKMIHPIGAQKKLVILVTDGKNQDRQDPKWKDLFQKWNQKKPPHLLVLGVGKEADIQYLKKIAQNLHGRVEKLHSLSFLGKKIQREVQKATGGAIKESHITAATPRRASYPRFQLSLGKYYLTSLKKRASLMLEDPSNHAPVLAFWPYHLGQVYAFTSALTPPWYQDRSEKIASFFEWLHEISHKKESSFIIHYLKEGKKIRIQAFKKGEPWWGLHLTIRSGDFSFPLEEIKPGVYQTSSIPLKEGIHPLMILHKKNTLLYLSQIRVPSQEEMDHPNYTLLYSLSQGRILENPEDLPKPKKDFQGKAIPLAPLACILCIIWIFFIELMRKWR